MPTSLSPYPNLEQLKKQAKDLRKAHAAGSVEAARRLKAYVRRFSDLGDEGVLADDLALRDAQHVIAREHGFAGWQQMLGDAFPEASAASPVHVFDSVAYSEADLLPVQILQVEVVERPNDRMAAVVLGDQERILLFITSEEGGVALSRRIKGRGYARPLTHDLLTTCVDLLQGSVVAVVIHQLTEGVFLAHVVLEVDGERKYVDARPSDSLNLAARQLVPIFVTRSVMEEAGQPLSSLPEALEKAAQVEAP